MKNELIAGGVGTALSVAGTAAQTNEILQTISLVITIIGALISFVVVPLLNWYKDAKKDDGKISEKEFKEGCKHLIEGMQHTKEFLDQTKNEDEREEIDKKGGRNNG